MRICSSSKYSIFYQHYFLSFSQADENRNPFEGYRGNDGADGEALEDDGIPDDL